MTTRTPRTVPARPPEHGERIPRKRASKRRLRALAWIAGGVAFVAPFTALASSPKPASMQRATGGSKPQVTVVRRITKRIVITHPAAQAPVQYVAPSGSGYSSSSSSSSGGTIAAPPPPTTSTSGS